jgi:hypothetical protein
VQRAALFRDTGAKSSSSTKPSRRTAMAEIAQNDIPGSGERIPAMQHVLDNPFLLLFIGIVMPTVFYIVWGVMEIVTIPIAR